MHYEQPTNIFCEIRLHSFI